MNKGILSIKIMILGAVIFLAGWEFALDGSLVATIAFMLAGPVLILVGFLMGNKKEKAEDDKNGEN